MEGHKLVRFVFLDEGGISKDEPVAVVAGVMVHADEQLIPLERELERIKRKHIPKELHDGFAFHATNIFSGTGKIFSDRHYWTLDRRMSILRDLARILQRVDLPIVHEAYPKAKLLEGLKPDDKPPSRRELSVAAHACAFAACTLRIEDYMRACFPDEIAQIVAEDNDQSRQMIKQVHDSFRFPERSTGIIPNNILPLRKIRGSVHFASKAESAPLQIADLCAFIIRGRLLGRLGRLSESHQRLNARVYDRLKTLMFMFAGADENYRGPKISVSPPYVVVDIEQQSQITLERLSLPDRSQANGQSE